MVDYKLHHEGGEWFPEVKAHLASAEKYGERVVYCFVLEVFEKLFEILTSAKIDF